MKKVEYIKHFGIKLFLIKSLRRLFINCDSKIAWKINDFNEKLINEKLISIIESVDQGTEFSEWMKKKNPNVPNEPIWVMWQQGISNAPDIVKCCVNSVIRNNPEHEVILLTEDNVMDYVELPDFVLEKFKQGIISRQHFADMVRLYLLYVYGGAWIDATVLNTEKISNECFQKDFYSIKFGKYTKDPSHGRWTTFCMFAREGNELIRDTLDMHYKYWYSQTLAVDYVMFDYFISCLVNKNEKYSQQVNSIEVNNKEVFSLIDKLNDKFNGKLPLEDGTILYKLSWKREYCRNVPDIGKTNYAIILEANNV